MTDFQFLFPLFGLEVTFALHVLIRKALKIRTSSCLARSFTTRFANTKNRNGVVNTKAVQGTHHC
jgi:hypothetical protein